MSKHDLSSLLAEALPKDVRLNVRHVSTPPTKCEAIFSAPPGEDPDSTFCESHFLAVSIRNQEEEIFVFGLEALVYTTDRLTTLFVSKADSTGYLHLLKLVPKISLLSLVSTTFLSYLARVRRRPGIRLVISLFARAQNQYLFPSSIDNPGKHVLDDRGLIKWWCRVLDPILREYDAELPEQDETSVVDKDTKPANSSAAAYLIVPGCDQFETRAFFPNAVKSDDKLRSRWRNSYPLHQICSNPSAPPRCLVPRFPDDPKARFLVDLDGELPEILEDDVLPKQKNLGHWRSVRCLDQFWEMMSFRQECSAGRLVGFLWLIVNSTPSVHQGAPFSWLQAGRGEIVLCESDYRNAHDFLLRQDFENEERSVSSTMAWIRYVSSLAGVLRWSRWLTGMRSLPEAGASSPGKINLTGSDLIRKRKKENRGDGNVVDGDKNSIVSSSVGLRCKNVQQSIPSMETPETAETIPSINVLNASFIRKKRKI